VVNGASDLMLEVFGDAGRHARTAIGVAVMPFDVAIEIEARFLIWT
jgi:enamine deaminase RidA (YjgF/YER057c/UK114 family)